VNCSKEKPEHNKINGNANLHPEVLAKLIYGSVRKDFGPIMRVLAYHKESEVVGPLMTDHVQ
jgi:hypothetical protein